MGAPVVGLDCFGKDLDAARAGDCAGCLLRDTSLRVAPGQLLAYRGGWPLLTEFTAEIHVPLPEEGGLNTSIYEDLEATYLVGTAVVPGTFTFQAGVDCAMAGENVHIKVQLSRAVIVREEQGFAMRSQGRTAATGVITKVLG